MPSILVFYKAHSNLLSNEVFSIDTHCCKINLVIQYQLFSYKLFIKQWYLLTPEGLFSICKIFCTMFVCIHMFCMALYLEYLYPGIHFTVEMSLVTFPTTVPPVTHLPHYTFIDTSYVYPYTCELLPTINYSHCVHT